MIYPYNTLKWLKALRPLSVINYVPSKNFSISLFFIALKKIVKAIVYVLPGLANVGLFFMFGFVLASLVGVIWYKG